MLVAPARLLGLGLIITRRVAVSLIRGPQYPRRNSSDILLKDISVKIIDRLTGGNRMRESFWQYRLDCFTPKGLNTRQVDT